MISDWGLPKIVVTDETNGTGTKAVVDSDDSSTDNKAIADGKRNQHAHEREMDDARKASAAEAARIVITSCLAGDLIEKQNAKRRKRIERARIAGGGSDHGPSRQPKEQKPGQEKERTFNDFMKKVYDPYPILYWECWHGKIPKRLEMHPMGVKWEGDEGEGVPHEEKEAEAEQGEDKKKETLRERAKRRIQSLSLTDRDSGTGRKWWSLRGEGSDKASKRGSLKGMFREPSLGNASSGSGSAGPSGREDAGSGGESAVGARVTEEKAPAIEQDYTIGIGDGKILDAESWLKGLGIVDPKDEDSKAVDYSGPAAEEDGGSMRHLHRRLSRSFGRSLSRRRVVNNPTELDSNAFNLKKPAYRVPPNTRVVASENSSSSSETYYSDTTGAPTQQQSTTHPRAASSLGGAGVDKSGRRSSLARLKDFGQLFMTRSRSHIKDESA